MFHKRYNPKPKSWPQLHFKLNCPPQLFFRMNGQELELVYRKYKIIIFWYNNINSVRVTTLWIVNMNGEYDLGGSYCITPQIITNNKWSHTTYYKNKNKRTVKKWQECQHLSVTVLTQPNIFLILIFWYIVIYFSYYKR